MRDIDFEELDRAVNRFLGVNNSKEEKKNPNNKAVESDKKSTISPRNASEFHKVAAVAPRGRFMDIVPAHRVVSVPVSTERPLKYTSKAKPKAEKSSPEIKDDFKIESARIRSRKTIDFKDDLKTTTPTDLNIEEADYQSPVLESISVEDVSVGDDYKQVRSFVGATDRPLEVVSREIAPIERQITPAPMRVGVFPVQEDEGMVIFGSDNNEAEKVLPEIKSKYSIDDVDSYDFSNRFKDNSSDKPESLNKESLQKDEAKPSSSVSIKTENPRIEKEKTLGIDDLTPANPFLPNARIEKRPLGSPRSSISNPQMMESKIIGSNPTKDKNQKISKLESREPILSSEDYATPIIRPKRKSGWVSVLVVLLIIVVCGVGLGLLAHFLTM